MFDKNYREKRELMHAAVYPLENLNLKAPPDIALE
jgi:hypothetical protein